MALLGRSQHRKMLVRRLLDPPTLRAFGAFALMSTAYAREYITGTSLDGVTQTLALDRTPALYTGDFGDCLGGESLLNVTKFDAAFYYDNSTILFHLDGTTNIRNEDVMLYISVEAYGESRFSMTVDPCHVNINSLCPLNATRPIEAFALFPIGPVHVSGIPQIAYAVPDIEGFARIQIFANSSRTEIGCFQAAMRNGHSFSQPASVSTVLGVFTVVAIIASFATAAYGVSIPHMRTHYAHSLSVLVVFETFQSIFYSGALSLPWPSVLPAWWSNFAWAAGLVPSSSIVHSIDPFVGVSGNRSQVGAAGSNIINNQGGLTQQIYGRSLISNILSRLIHKAPASAHKAVGALEKRQAYNPNDPYDYNWNGDPVEPGMPLPGDWTGFAGELSALGIPTLNAFMVGLIWSLIALGLVIFFLVGFKFSLEVLAKLRWIKQDRLEYFRTHWTSYLGLSVLRTLFIATFSLFTLAIFQFTLNGPAGPTAIAAIVFFIMVVGIGGLSVYTLHFRLRSSELSIDSDRILLHSGKILGFIPCVVPVRLSRLREKELAQKPAGSLPFIRFHFVDQDPNRKNVHLDEPWVKRFGWLSARYRLSRWWFFAFWLVHQLARACFLGAAWTHLFAQLFGLFIIDILALIVIAALNPYEGQRNTALAVWLLGITRVATTGLSIAFLPDFNLDRMVATVIGVVIIVIQGLLTIAVMILIIIGGISSWMSLSRNREYFSSEMLEGVRIRYFEHIAQKATDELPPPKPKSKPKTESEPNGTVAFPDLPKEPHFSVNSVRRAPKIEDEDEDYIAEMNPVRISGTPALGPGHVAKTGRTSSMSSRHSVSSLPRAARVHRASWSSRDFSQWQADQDRPDPALVQRLSSGPTHVRSDSLKLGATRRNSSVGSLGASGTPAPGSRPMTPTKEVAEGDCEGPDEAKEIPKGGEKENTENPQQP
ncbi:TRP-domain-containing protein [Durotheca rogersii]|uniref:TRP-domain-containing protein n=1 Tax=Durotheca rogersii TaxID=419775 RepID=UPI00221E711E|nr:TRP-domain-containing protein [Durotheca rogersii]KAI5867715.1 TRP-domain-containing protein [Durotheca rogersii]